jgi:hypothetical protein
MSILTNPMHPYSLRARISKTDTKVVSAAASISDQEISDSNDPSPGSRRLFSDVVTGNKTLKLRGGHDKTSQMSEEEDSLQDLSTTKRSEDQEDPALSQNFSRWTTKNPNLRQSRSLSSLDDVAKAAKSKAEKPMNIGLANDLVAAAENLLTAAQKNKIDQRNDKVTNAKAARYASFTSVGEGPSKIKGKGVDPFNWGNANLSEEDLDPAVQQAALDSIKRNPNKRSGNTARDISQPPVLRRDQAARPVGQILPDSYLGQTLKNIHRLGTKKRKTLRSGDDPSSPSSSSSYDSSESESNRDDHDLNGGPSDRTTNKRRSHSKGKKKSKRSHKSGLKPIAPKEYDGSADARAYNRFVTEGTTYVIDGRVPRNRRVFVLSYYLDSVAYDFYTQKVSMNFANWTLQEFFEELYNYCFPVNYRMEQRLKLKRSFQNDKKVSAYVHELKELYNMIGAVDERDKVIKLWYGLRTSIQQGLWRDLLNPETSTWEEVADHASIIEIAHNVSENKDRRHTSDPKPKIPNSQGNSRPGNSNRKTRGFQPHRSGSQPFPRPSSERFPTPRVNGRFSSQRPSGSNNRFGSRAPLNGSPSSRFTPKPFEKPKSNISDKEKAELLASGKCFTCKEAGHLARNCPKGNTMRSSGSRPPGVPNFNIELEALNEEESEEDLNDEGSEEIEIIYTLQASVINIQPREIPHDAQDVPAYAADWDRYDPTSPCQTHIGDAWAKIAEEALFIAQPLPGDSAWIARDPLQHRFHVIKEYGPFYAIYDRHQLRRAEIHEEYLKDPYFRLGCWYAKQLCLKFRIPDVRNRRLWTMGDALGQNTARVLCSGITSLYPSQQAETDDELRFEVVQNGINYWDIHDDDFAEDPINVPRHILENQNLDLCNWYLIRRRARQVPSNTPNDSDNEPPANNSNDVESATGIYSSFEITREGTGDTVPESQTQTVPPQDSPIDNPSEESRLTPEQVWELGAQGLTTRLSCPIGDVMGRTLLAILEGSGPYPGDKTHEGPEDRLRFIQVEFRDSCYIIKDNDRNEEVYYHLESLTETCLPALRYAERCAQKLDIFLPPKWRFGPQLTMGTALEDAMERAVENGRPYLNEDYQGRLEPRCRVLVDPKNRNLLIIKDLIDSRAWRIPRDLLRMADFDAAKWYQETLAHRVENQLSPFEMGPDITFEQVSFSEFIQGNSGGTQSISPPPYVLNRSQNTAPLLYMSDLVQEDSEEEENPVFLNGIQVTRGTFPAMQRNAAVVKAPGRPVPKPVVITVKINDHPARALLDSGSLGDFISTTLADQLKLTKEVLEVPLGLQLAVQGSRSKINSRAKAKVQYQDIGENRYFDIINLSYYDIILGTPWLFQHSICLGFNPARVLIGSDTSLPINGKSVSSIASRAMNISQTAIDRAREELIAYAEPLCKGASETGLPPFREINHKIPLIDTKKIYPWHPSRCPEVFRDQWAEKRDAYLRTGRWRVTTSGNTVPMLLIPKPRAPGGPLLLRTVVDLRARNDNTVKQTSPLPDPEGILRRAAAHPFRSLMDGKDAYEQIRVDSDHVDRTAVTTPDGNMVSLVIQIGDCNAPATYQALMNHISHCDVTLYHSIWFTEQIQCII